MWFVGGCLLSVIWLLFYCVCCWSVVFVWFVDDVVVRCFVCVLLISLRLALFSGCCLLVGFLVCLALLFCCFACVLRLFSFVFIVVCLCCFVVDLCGLWLLFVNLVICVIACLLAWVCVSLFALFVLIARLVNSVVLVWFLLRFVFLWCYMFVEFELFVFGA